MTEDLHVHIGEDLDTLGARAIDAWRRLDRGEDVREKHVGFATWEDAVRILSPKRLALLRHLHRHPATSIRALAKALGRDYRRVHDDVHALQEAGLIDHDRKGLRADFEGFDLRMRVAL